MPGKFVKAEGWLHESAAAQAGLNDLGGLRVLLEALDNDLKGGQAGVPSVYAGGLRPDRGHDPAGLPGIYGAVLSNKNGGQGRPPYWFKDRTASVGILV